MMPKLVKKDPAPRIFHLHPYPVSDAKVESVGLSCERDTANAPLNGVDPEIYWSAPDFQVAAFHDEAVVFDIKDMQVAGQTYRLAVISSSALMPHANWTPVPGGCRSPAFVYPGDPLAGERIVVSVTLILVATGSQPATASDDVLAAPPVRYARRPVKIIFTPHVGG